MFDGYSSTRVIDCILPRRDQINKIPYHQLGTLKKLVAGGGVSLMNYGDKQ